MPGGASFLSIDQVGLIAIRLDKSSVARSGLFPNMGFVSSMIESLIVRFGHAGISKG